MMASQPMADSNVRVRWDALRGALAARYANAAEAYVAMGGRAGGELSLLQLERSLQDLNARVLGLRRGAVARQSVDVHGILSDVESAFQSGINFQQFASSLAWEDKKTEVLKSREMIAGRVLAGAPASALRTSRENENPALPRVSTAGSVKRPGSPSMRSVGGSPATRKPDDSYRDARSWAFPDWKGKKWTGSQAPPAHFLQEQRRKVALHSAVSQEKNAKMLKSHSPSTKMDAIEAAEAKLKMLAQIDDEYQAKQPKQPIQPLVQKAKEPLARISQTQMRNSYEQHLPSPPPASFQARPHSPDRLGDNKAEIAQQFQQQQDKNTGSAMIAMSSKAAELSDRLTALNSSVFQQKLSLAETEKNILLKERQELQAQIRQMNHIQKASQMEMQNKMTDQFGKAMKETFEQIKDVMKSMQGAEKKDLVSLNEAYEAKIRKELLHLAAEGSNPENTLVEKRTELYGPLNTTPHNYFDSVISVRAETEGERIGNGFFFHLYDAVEKISGGDMKQSKDHVDAGNPHSTKAPFLLSIINSVQYNPVLSWYTVDSQDLPHAGSVGKLARLDPLNGQDYVDDFLLEMLLAIRLNQIFPAGVDPQSGQSILGTILPIMIGGEHPQRFTRNFAQFPREKLHLLSSHPSIETAKVAATLLHSVGVATPEYFLRLSVREVVGKIMDFPGIWMDKFESKHHAQMEAAKLIVGLGRAEGTALVAKTVEARGLSDRDAVTKQIAAETSVGDGTDEEEGEDSEDEDDLSRQQKLTAREQRKAMIEVRNKRALQRKLEENQEMVAVEKKKTDCLAHFEKCYRELGFDAQAKNLAHQALKQRGIFLQEIMLIQKQGPIEDEDEATKRKLEKAMRRFARTEGILKKNSFENWVAYKEMIRNFMQKVGWRSNLKKMYFDKWNEWFSEFQGSKAMSDKLHAKKNAHHLHEAWFAWRELHEEEAEKRDEETVNTTDPAHLASLLRKLEAAVIETHQKHSCLLEMTNNEEIMSTLLQKLSPAACDTLRDAGITKLEHLVHLTMGTDKAGPYNDQKLQSYGLTDPHDLKRVEMFLVNPESFELGGLAQPAGDFDQKREQLLDDMSSLREKLDLKKQKLMDEFPDEAAQNQATQPAVKKDPNLGVLHELLGALGVSHDEPAAVEEAAETRDEAQGEESDFPGEKEQAVRDKETASYIAKLKSEGTANQSVLKALAHTLGEVGENADDKEVVDTDTQKAKNAFAEKIESMEKTMDIFVNAMSRARELLDKDESDDEEQKSAVKTGGLVEPYDRAEELGIGAQTHAEMESQKLAADVERRGKQAAALEQENILLKSQIESLSSMKARPPVSRPVKSSDGRKRSPKQHWATQISDPELAQKYGQAVDESEGWFFGDGSVLGEADDEDGGSTLEDRYLDTNMIATLLPNEDKPTNFAWSLNAVDGTTPFTRSSLFDSLLEDKIQSGREALMSYIDETQVELDEVQKDASDARELVDTFREKHEELQKKGAKSYRPNPKQLQEQVLANDREWREAENRLKTLEKREAAVKSSLDQLKSQFDALDLRKELDDIDRKMTDEVAASTEELNGLIDAEELDPTPEVSERIAEARDKVHRIEASWKLKRNMRIKEIEIEVMGQKMAEDEAMLKNDVSKSKGVYINNANDARGNLANILQTMEDSVTNTARGRCRPEVLASMPAVQKLQGAVNRHKLALETAQLTENNKLREQQRAEKEKREEEELKKIEAEEMKKMRQTGDLAHREKRFKDIADALQKKKQEMFAEASVYLEDAKNAWGSKNDFSKMYISKVDGARRHAKSFVLDAKALYDELNGTVDEATEQQTHQELQARQNEVTKLVEEMDKCEATLVETIKNDALSQIDWLTKQDLRKMSDTLAEKVAGLRALMLTLLPNLDELNTVEDTARCKSRALSQVEEKLRHGWARLAPKLDDALYKELAVGDHSLDVVQAALASGKLSTAHRELQKAEEAYKKVQSARR